MSPISISVTVYMIYRTNSVDEQHLILPQASVLLRLHYKASIGVCYVKSTDLDIVHHCLKFKLIWIQ